MGVKLVIAGGPTRTRVIPLRSANTVIGRAKGCQVRIPSSEVSRRHCRLSFENGWLTVKDLGSFNGTFLNGVRITGKQRARPGDQLQIGPLTFTVDYPLPQTSKRRGPPPVEPVEEEQVPIDLASTDEELIPLEDPDDKESEPEIEIDLDPDDSWKLPEGEDLNDLLGELGDG